MSGSDNQSVVQRAAPFCAPAETKACRGGGYIVRFKKDMVPAGETKAFADRLAGRHGIVVRRVFCRCIRGFSVRGDISDELRDRIAAEELVESVELDLQVCAAQVTEPASSWSLRRLGFEESEEPREQVDAHVIILDTGVQRDHPSLNVVEAMSFIDDEPEVEDFNGHGTQSAGCSTGTAPGVKIHSYKVLGRDGGGCLSDVISGIERAVEYSQESGERKIVLNLSLGAYVGTSRYIALDEELRDAVVDHGLVAVVAAGNSSMDTAMFSPGHVKEAITVGAYGDNDQFASFSNYGSDVDLLAPGQDVPTTTINSSTTVTSGTSFSSPYVAGLAAAYIAKNPAASPKDVLGHLIDAATQASDSGKNKSIQRVPAQTVSLSAYR